MAVLETIAAANAAYSVIKKCLENGREVKDMVGHVGKFLNAEDELKDAVKRKKSSPIAAITGGSEGDWEEFQALEKLKEQRKELESWCRLYGPREELLEAMTMGIGVLFAVTGIAALVFALGKYMGKW